MKIKNLHFLLFFIAFNFSFLAYNANAQVCFSPVTDFSVGSGPTSVASADFNGDGNTDLVTANNNSGNGGNSLSILFGNGAGSFAPIVDFGNTVLSGFVITADFNGDNKIDLATVEGNQNQVSIFIGHGDGTFNTPVIFPLLGDSGFVSGTIPISVVSADFNGDGKIDLATANSGGAGSVTILIGDGTGNFIANTFSTGSVPYYITSADFNSDGKADLAIANTAGSFNTTILLGDGLGGFNAAPNILVSSYQRSIICSDFNGDGKIDLAITSFINTTYKIKVFLGNGTGGFTATTPCVVSNIPYNLTSGDFNSDGKPDLAVTIYNDNSISVFLGDGTGNFSTATSFTVGNGPYALTNSDFNGDGKTDLAVTNMLDDNVSILLNTLPVVNANATATTICSGGSLTLTGSGTATSYSWTGGAIDGIAFSGPLSNTTYTVTGTIPGCSKTSTITITVNSLPISSAGNDLTICSGIAGSIGSIAVSGNTYSWNSAIGITDSTVSNPTNTTINSTSTPIVTSYTVTTTNTATTCQSTDIATITVNPQPVLAITAPATVCFPNTVDITTGSTTAGSTGGGILTYWTDAGATNALTSPNIVPASGTNYIKVTATGGCTDIAPVTIIVNPQPTATLTTSDESSSLYCDGFIVADLTGGTGTIMPEWLDNTQTVLANIDSIGALCSGSYTLNLIDANLCTNTYTQTVQAGPIPPSPPICLITVDSTNSHNIIVWEKTSLDMTAIDSFIVYREINTNNYLPIGSVAKDSLSTFDDFAANPATTGYRYKLKSKNTHGVPSLFCDYHNTIYLNNNGANFNWTPYQVENNTTPVSNYNVYRDDNSTGNFILIGNTTGNQFGYTDIQFSSFPNASYYVEALMVAGACQPTRSGFAASRSNIKHIGSVGIQQFNNFETINIFPNPANKTLNISGITGTTIIRLYDVIGELVAEKEAENNTSLNTSNLVEGIYTLSIESKIGKSFNKIVISR